MRKFTTRESIVMPPIVSRKVGDVAALGRHAGKYVPPTKIFVKCRVFEVELLARETSVMVLIERYSIATVAVCCLVRWHLLQETFFPESLVKPRIAHCKITAGNAGVSRAINRQRIVNNLMLLRYE